LTVTTVKTASKKSLWRDTFERAYEEGRFKEAAAIFNSAGGDAGTELLFKGARAHMHFDPSTSLKLLLKIPPDAPKRSDRIERDALLTEAFARTKDFESADERLAAALQNALKVADKNLLAMVGYRGVRRYLLDGNPAAARGYLDFARAGLSPEAIIYAAYAEAIILGYEERVHEQATRLTELLQSLNPNATSFMEIRAWSTHTLAGLARELYIPTAIAEIDRQLTGQAWSLDFAPNRFQALRSLAWAKASQGDYFNAFRHFKSASAVAPSAAWKVLAACDQSLLARCFGEHRWSRIELDEAEQIATDVDWHATLAEERMGLLSLAELFSTLDTARSAMYLARYRELGDIKSPLYYGHDARRDAYAKYSTGIIEIALGNSKRGLAELRHARAVFERFGYDFRVARCLLAEFRLTKNRNLVPAITERLRHYSQSWLMNELASVAGSSIAPLPPMQQRVFAELCKGKSTAEIAAEFGRSEYTISNHIKAIFKTMGVKSRSALLAKAARQGTLP
jgi:DNA-binding CsgD family transcriptional regulator